MISWRRSCQRDSRSGAARNVLALSAPRPCYVEVMKNLCPVPGRAKYGLVYGNSGAGRGGDVCKRHVVFVVAFWLSVEIAVRTH